MTAPNPPPTAKAYTPKYMNANRIKTIVARTNKAIVKAAAEIPKNSRLIPQFFDYKYSNP